jgi:beta-phosphoglucomutase
MLEAIIFDFDGVIVNTEPLHYRAFLGVMQPRGVTFSYEKYKEDYIGFDDRDAFRAICSEFGQPLHNGKLQSLIDAKAAEFERLAKAGVQPFPGVVELIDAAARAAMPIAIASGALRHDIDVVLGGVQSGRLLKQFRTIVTADDVDRSKPDPAPYILAAQRLGVNPAKTVAIEDTAAGLVSARAAGLRTLGVETSYPADKLGVADKFIRNLAGVTPALLDQWFA